ncbi:class I SAM-dependent methyltransferase [Endothiovibrio diazotrophicus]
MKEEQASSTAFTVLQGILLTASKPIYAGVVAEEVEAAAREILAASEEGRRRLQQVESPLYRTLAPLAERLALPGFALHYVLRKRFIEEAALKALADGYTQVVSLGAGFDTLEWRLHRQHPEVTFIEIDHPATSAVKREALKVSGENLHLLAVDLAEHDLEAVLRDCTAFDPARPTLYICEGVLVYLPPDAVTGLFATLKRLSGAGTRFVFTAVSPIGSPRNNTGPLLRLYLALKNEPLAWNLEQADLEAFVTLQGYRLIDQANDADLAPRYLPGGPAGPLHQGEFLALAEAE